MRFTLRDLAFCLAVIAVVDAFILLVALEAHFDPPTTPWVPCMDLAPRGWLN